MKNYNRYFSKNAYAQWNCCKWRRLIITLPQKCASGERNLCRCRPISSIFIYGTVCTVCKYKPNHIHFCTTLSCSQNCIPAPSYCIINSVLKLRSKKAVGTQHLSLIQCFYRNTSAQHNIRI